MNGRNTRPPPLYSRTGFMLDVRPGPVLFVYAVVFTLVVHRHSTAEHWCVQIEQRALFLHSSPLAFAVELSCYFSHSYARQRRSFSRHSLPRTGGEDATNKRFLGPLTHSEKIPAAPH